MKKFSALLAILFITIIIVPELSVSAAGTDILYGTPVLDGVLDEMYTYSASIEIENFEFYSEKYAEAGPTTCEGTTAYILWDDTYVYVCTVVNDATATAAVSADVDYTAWNTNDNVELYFYNDGVGGQIHVNALGQGLTTAVKEYGDITVAGKATDTGYVVEVAIKVKDDLFKLQANTEFGFCLQYNDYLPANGTIHASGYQAEWDETIMKLSAEAAPVPETEAPAPETEAPTAAQTFDIIGFAAAAAVISGGIVLSKKSGKK